MKCCLITGVSGLIGTHLLRELVDEWSIWGVSRHAPPQSNVDFLGQHLTVDLAADWHCGQLPDKIDTVIHLAQSEHFREFPEHAEQVFQVNTVSTLRLFDYARRAGAQTFVLASSGGIYGFGDQEFSEDIVVHQQSNLGFYLGTKLCAEIIAESYTPFMNVIILRFFFVYGPGQRPNMLIPRLVQTVSTGKSITLQGDDGVQINPTYVADAAVAIKHALHLKGSHKINVAGPEVLCLRQIGELIGRTVARTPKFDVQSDIQPRHLIGDIRKMTHLLGAPRISFTEGIQRMLAQKAQQYDN